MNCVLEASELSKRYGRVWALRNLRLAIPEGGIVGLVGPNGAGKSTLLKSWVGFEKPTSGRALVLGVDPWSNRDQVLSRVSYLAQRPMFYRDLTVADHLAYVAYYRRNRFDRQEATRRLDDLGIPLRAAAGSLSGGQLAQLGLAIAFSLRSEVLLLDEPLASLDPLARRECIDILVHEVSKSGATTMLSSHIISDIEQACTAVVLLAAGEVLLNRTVDDLKRQHMTSSPAHHVQDAVPVASLPDGRSLWRNPQSGDGPGTTPASLDEIVLGYLVAARGKL